MLISGSGKTIMKKTRLADTFPKKLKGLMFEKKKNFDYALIFELPLETRIGASVHMMFVFFPIEIVYLDSKKKVVDKATLNPWTLNYTPKKPAKYFVEMPKRQGKKIRLGEKLGWEKE